MRRAWLSVGFCALALGLGVVTARLAAENRARGADLVRRHIDCETRVRQNALLSVENGRLEWLVLHGREGELQVPVPGSDALLDVPSH